MSDQTTLNQAAQVISTIGADQRADTALRFFFERHRYIRPEAKRVISHAVFSYYRWLQWLDPKASPQKRVEHATSLHARFAADPKTIKPEALAALAVPGWLAAEATFPLDSLRQLQRDPALWLRARPASAAKLAAALGNCEHSDRAPDALRFTGRGDLFRTEAFKSGDFEIQDLASQLVGHACAPQPGQTWWDACAGEGGKTLHLADLMANKGLVWATDRHDKRLETLKRRFARAKLFNYRTALWDGSAKLPTKTKFDGILVDAPCSGVGTWQRNPQARWTATPNDVSELAVTQRALLDHVAGSLKPGGRLVYAVCTVTAAETSAVADAFTAAHPEFAPADVLTSSATPPSPQLLLWPHELNANGMFIAAWTRKK